MAASTKQKILAYIKKRKSVKSLEILEKIEISRQMLARHLKSLIQEGELVKKGSTRSAEYLIATKKANISKVTNIKDFTLLRQTKSLSEDQVFSEVDLRLNLKTKLSKKAHSMFYYAFTEMLNNVIDHSGAKKVEVKIVFEDQDIKFEIIDLGVGIFKHVQKFFKLEDEFSGLEHVLKGKQTTFEKQHTGQGIFFTSRIADEFIITSHKISLKINNKVKEKFVGEVRFKKGTRVQFKINKNSRKNIEDIFKKYTNNDYEFDRTDIQIKFKGDERLVSRSQARRILIGLDKYKIITFDFKNVQEIGQGFVDEIFRIYKSRYPQIQILYINTNKAVEFMILRGLEEK